MRKLLVFSALSTVPFPTAAASNKPEVAEAIGAVISAEAQLYGDIPGDVTPCVKPPTAGGSLDRLSVERASLVRITLGRDDPGLRREYRRKYEGYARLGRWARPYADGRGKIIYLGSREAWELDEAARAATDAKHHAGTWTIKGGWLSPPYRLCRSGDATPTLELSLPVFQSNFAFVAAKFDCALCGHGTTYALRRTSDRWQVIAEIVHWVS